MQYSLTQSAPYLLINSLLKQSNAYINSLVTLPDKVAHSVSQLILWLHCAGLINPLAFVFFPQKREKQTQREREWQTERGRRKERVTKRDRKRETKHWAVWGETNARGLTQRTFNFLTGVKTHTSDLEKKTHKSDLKTGTLVATLLGAWHYWISAKTG